jgi:hypothetical protein
MPRRLLPTRRPTAGQLAFVLVTLVGLYLLWPIPLGRSPLSADHTVHLARIWQYQQILSDGQLRGWSDLWFFGAPIGELYPVLGDLLTLLIHAVTGRAGGLGAAYAWMLSLVFLSQAWALLHLGRALRLGTIPGLLGALLVLLDAGAYREGGWTYTILYGVWPQTLATTLMLLAIAEAAQLRLTAPHSHINIDIVNNNNTKKIHRHLAFAALAGAGALLAHPMAMLGLALAALAALPIFAREPPATNPQAHKPSGDPARQPLAAGLAAALIDLAAVGALAVALAAWWLFPMLEHRAWMTSYGWLHLPLARLADMAVHGQWAQNMPPAVGAAAALGLLIALRGGPLLRLIAAWSLGQWLLSSSDLYWWLRLDHLSAGFGHVQYQRLLAAAKPGLFLLAGVGAWGLRAAALRLYRGRLRAHIRVPLLLTLLSAGLLLVVSAVRGAHGAALTHKVGQPPLARFPDHPGRDLHYSDLLEWLRQRQIDEPGRRIAFEAHRNAHWFMDSPLTTGAPTYKIGFTPGDNFVHKPESADPALLDRLGVRYLVTLRPRRRGPPPRVSFGPFHVFERSPPPPGPWLEGPGALELLRADGRHLRVTGAGPDTRLIFPVAGYPRWQLNFSPQGALSAAAQPIPWIEVPALPSPPTHLEATPAQRRAGALRGGKAGGDDGTEPTLIAAPARDGEFFLNYITSTISDRLAALLSLSALLALLPLLRGRGPHARLRALARRLLSLPLLTLALSLVIIFITLRYSDAAASERHLASSWLSRGRATIRGPGERLRPGPLKADMWIQPAILLHPRAGAPAIIEFPQVSAPDRLRGWIALDDDDAKEKPRGQHHLEIAARPHHSDAPWRPLYSAPLPHRPGKQPLDLPTRDVSDRSDDPAQLDLRVTLTTTGQAPPRLGFDLELAPRPRSAP